MLRVVTATPVGRLTRFAVVFVLAAVLMLSVESRSALAGGTETISAVSLTSLQEGEVESTVLHWPEIGLGDEPFLGTGMQEAAVGGGVLRIAGEAGVIYVGSQMVAKVLDHFTGNYIYKLWTGRNEEGQAPLASNVRWRSVAGESWSYFGYPPGAAYELSSDQGTAYSDNCPCSNDSTNGYWDLTARAVWSNNQAGSTYNAGTLTDTAVKMERTSFTGIAHNGSCPWPQLNQCFILTKTEAQAGASIDQTGTGTATDCTNAGANCYTITPATSCDHACLVGALAQINAGDTSKQSPAEAAAVHKLRVDAGLDATVPDCAGLTVVDCETALQQAGFTATPTAASASNADANLVYPAGAVIVTSPAADASVDVTAPITITTNPDPLPIVWPVANPLETYSTYLARLRDLGWLGDATVVDLDSSTGNVDYGLDGVPCTSVVPSRRVAATDPVTFFHNPVAGSFDDNLSTSSGDTCGDSTLTSADEPVCSFFPQLGTWEFLTGADPLFYQVSCESTRSYIASLNPFAADGTINSTAITIARLIADGTQLWDDRVREFLAPDGPENLANFQYVSSQRMTDDDDREFEIHFYVQKDTGKAVLGLGYKIRWIYWFQSPP